MRSWARPSSSQIQRTFWTFTELARPQTMRRLTLFTLVRSGGVAVHGDGTQGACDSASAASISRLAMLSLWGSGGSASGVNHPAASISPSCGVMSPPA